MVSDLRHSLLIDIFAFELRLGIVSEHRTHPEYDRNDEKEHSDRVRQEDFVHVVVEGGGDQPRRSDRRNGGRGRRFDRDNSSVIEIEIKGATVRVAPRTDRVLLNIVLDALRTRR